MHGIKQMNDVQLRAALLRAQHRGAASTAERIEQEIRQRCSSFCCGKQAAMA